MAFSGAVVIRYNALEPVQIMDTSMAPKIKERSVVWICKLPQCINQVKDQDYVLAKVHSNENILRRVLATPGDSISISDKGKVITPHRNFKWKNEDAFIQSRSIYVPKIGDTLYFDQLNDVEQDYIISLLRSTGDDVFVKTTLWQGDREINIDRVGSTKIANRQVSLKEIDFLPWQDRNLIELQIRQSEPGNAPIKLKRKLFRRKAKNKPIDTDSLQQASSVDISLSAPPSVSPQKESTIPPPKPAPLPEDTTKVISEEIADTINQIIINKNCYFLACERGNNCPDSRELGYFTKENIVGLHLKKPDEFKHKFIHPALSYLRAAKEIIKDLWITAKGTGKQGYHFLKETFIPEEKKDEASDSTKTEN